MVVLATAAMVTRQVSTGGVSKVAARAPKWKEMEVREQSGLYQGRERGAKRRRAAVSLAPRMSA